MECSNSTPKVFVLTKTTIASEKVSQAFLDDPVRIIHVNDSHLHAQIFNDLEAACVLVEIAQDPEQELEALTALQPKDHSLPLIAISNQWTISSAVKAIKSGANDVCDLQEQVEDLRKIVHKAIANDTPRYSELRDVIPNSILQKLDSEEARIIHLIVLGLTAKEIGSALDVSIRTYHYRKKSIFQKLDVANRSELIELIRTSNGRITEWHNAHTSLPPSHLRRTTFANQNFLNT